jgi:DNA-binding response OmpR family regulator
MSKVLLVEDDADLTETIVRWLRSEQYTVEAVNDGKEGMERLDLCQYDLVILDWSLPGMTGVEIVERFRGKQGRTPVLMLTGKSAVADKAVGLDAGADDYLIKPFSLIELSARLRALLRRSGSMTSNILQVRNITVDRQKHKVTRDGEEIHLLPKEFSLLEFFMRHPDEVFSVEALMQRVWHADSNSSIDAIRTCIKRLRDKIDVNDDNPLIQTIPRVGYKLKGKT